MFSNAEGTSALWIIEIQNVSEENEVDFDSVPYAIYVESWCRALRNGGFIPIWLMRT